MLILSPIFKLITLKDFAGPRNPERKERRAINCAYRAGELKFGLHAHYSLSLEKTPMKTGLSDNYDFLCKKKKIKKNLNNTKN